MANTCCQLVGDLDLGIGDGVISVSTGCSTEIITSCGNEPLEGASIGTINISAYASDNIWIGCPSKAGVNIPFIRKYDCVNDVVYFIFSGQGQSFYTGEASQFVSLNSVLNTTCESFSASSSSGPATIYMRSTQVNGYGMSYSGNPISFETTAEGTTITLGGELAGTYYLQSFNLDLNSGQLPTVTYSLVYPINGGIQ